MKRLMAAALLTLAFNVPPATATSPRTEGLPDELARVRQQLLLSEDLLTCAPVGTPAHGRAAGTYDRLSAEASVIEELAWTESKFDGSGGSHGSTNAACPRTA